MPDKLATPISYVSGGGAIFFGLAANEIAALVGASVAVLTFFVNLWFKCQHLKLAKDKCEKD